MLNILLAPQRDSTQTEAPRVVHTYTLGTSAALGMNCAVIPSFIIYTNVPRQSATAGLRLHGLLDSDQNNCQIVCEHCCSPSLTGNTIHSVYNFPATHAPYFGAHVQENKLSAGATRVTLGW